MASETFHLKQGAARPLWRGVGLCVILGIAAIAFAGPVSEDVGDMSPGTARAIMVVIGLLLLAGGGYFAYLALQSGKWFLTLSDQGMNLNNKWTFSWMDIESVEEEAIPIKAAGVTTSTKYKLSIRYLDQRERKVKKTFIASDVEGYEFIKARVMGKFEEGRGSGST